MPPPARAAIPAYPEYKDSGVEWLGEVPRHWDVRPVKYNVRLLTEKAETRGNPIGLENVESWTGRHLPTESDFEGTGIAFDRRDILFGKLRPYLAKVLLAESAGEAVGDFHVLRPGESVFPHYVQYQMLERVFIDIVDGSTFGSKMPRASWDFVGMMRVPTPPLDEQAAIAAFLDRETAKIDALVAEQRRLIELLTEKRRAMISHAVTKGLNPNAPMKHSGIDWLGEVPEHWEITRLGSVCAFRSGKAHEPFAEDDGEHIMVTARFVSTGGLSARHCSVNITPANAGDVLMVMSDLPNGRALARAFLIEDARSYAVNQRVCALTPTQMDARYLRYILNRCPGLLQNDDGSNQTHLSNADFTKLTIACPPLSQQAEISDYLDEAASSIDGLIAKCDEAIGFLSERRTALISAAVTGRIDVRGSVPATPEEVGV